MIYIATDHTGHDLKNFIVNYLNIKKVDVVDLSVDFDKNDDYPDVAEKLCKNVLENSQMGIAICGTGIRNINSM